MIEAGLILFCVVAAGMAWWWRRECLAAQRALREWADRWAVSPLLCAVPGCGEPPEADCHVQYPDEEVRALVGHRFMEARLVPKPAPMVREAAEVYR